VDYQKIKIKGLKGVEELSYLEGCFFPNPTTNRFARAINKNGGIKEGDLVFDIGTGIAPLAIWAALQGAGRVIGVDPVKIHCESARQNVINYSLEGKVDIYQGGFFGPFNTQPKLKGLQADVIIGDVSGISDAVSKEKGLGWYSNEVPTGGPDGTDVIIEFLKRAHKEKHLKKGGQMYFPIATDLSDGDKILKVVQELYGGPTSVLEVVFPLTPEQVLRIDESFKESDDFNRKTPGFINIRGRNSKRKGKFELSWTGHIYSVTV